MNPKLPKYAYFFSVLLLFVNLLYAQEQKKKSRPTTSYFKASLDYLSNAVYNGRKDSLVTPYYTPAIGYYDKSGFFISGSVSYLSSAAESRIDVFSIDLGYDFTASDKLSGGVYANKSFYNQSSSTVRSSLNAGLGAYLSYDAGIVAVQGGIDAVFSKSTDINANGSLSHAFNLGEGEEWTLSPTVSFNAGTQNFYQDYFRNRKKSFRANRNGNQNTIVVKGYNSFNVLDYELALPLAYEAKSWGLSFKPVYAIPVNPVSISLNNGTTYTIEKLENSFYVEAGIYFKF